MAKAANTRWWDADEYQAHDALGTVVRHIHDRNSWRRQADALHAELYAGGPGAAGISMNARLHYDYEASSLPYNICRKVVEKALSKVVRHRPLPQALTTKGNWTQQKRARKLTQFIDGEFYRQGIFTKHAKMIVRDALIFGRGIIKIYRAGKSIHSERVHPWEVYVDDWDARYGDPQNYYHVRTIDKGVLLARFGKKRDDESKEAHEERVQAIENATVGGGVSEYDWQDEQDATVDRVRIVEAWHLPSDPDSKDDADKGRHVISLLGGSATLIDEDWEHDCPPLVILQYGDALAGFWGQGLVEQAEGFQYEINDMSQKVSDGHWMLGGGMILVPTGSDIVDTSLHNGNIPIVKHQPGKAPQFVTPNPIHPQCYQRLRDLPMDCESNLGMPQMTDSIRGAAESGMSGIALQALDDVETERFVIFGRDYEEWCRQVAKHFVNLAKEVASEFGDYAVSVPMKGGILQISWADVSLDEVELKVYSGSLLPQQINARLDKLKTLFDSGVIDRGTFLRYLDAPDLSAEFDVETAGRLNIDERIEAMLEAEGEDIESSYRSPSTYSSPGMLEWGRQRAQMRYERAELDGAPEENLELLRRFITDSQKLIDRMKPPPAPPGPDLMAGQPTAPPPPGMGQMPLEGAPLAA